MPAGPADVAELAYALDSKSSGREVMRVQLPPSAPTPYPRLDSARFVLRSGLEAVSFDPFVRQSGGDGNTHGNTRRETPACSLDSARLAARRNTVDHASGGARRHGISWIRSGREGSGLG